MITSMILRALVEDEVGEGEKVDGRNRRGGAGAGEGKGEGEEEDREGGGGRCIFAVATRYHSNTDRQRQQVGHDSNQSSFM